jgi:hypothetical protein
MVSEGRQESPVVTHEKQFSWTMYEDDKQVNGGELDDPFIRTTIRLKGLKTAWRILWHGLKLNVCVDGTRAAHNVVFRGEYDDKKWFPGGPKRVMGEMPLDQATANSGGSQ